MWVYVYIWRIECSVCEAKNPLKIARKRNEQKRKGREETTKENWVHKTRSELSEIEKVIGNSIRFVTANSTICLIRSIELYIV